MTDQSHAAVICRTEHPTSGKMPHPTTTVHHSARQERIRPANYTTIDQIKRANNEHGGAWFSPGATRFFRTRVHSKVYGGAYFVTSEQGPDGVRRYSVRQAHNDGRISTRSDFQEFATRDQAHAYAASLGGAA